MSDLFLHLILIRHWIQPHIELFHHPFYFWTLLDRDQRWPTPWHSYATRVFKQCGLKTRSWELRIFLISISGYNVMWAVTGKQIDFFIVRRNRLRELCPYKEMFQSNLHYTLRSIKCLCYTRTHNTPNIAEEEKKRNKKPHSLPVNPTVQLWFPRRTSLYEWAIPGFSVQPPVPPDTLHSLTFTLSFTVALNLQRQRWPQFKLHQPSLSQTNQLRS